MVLEKPIHLVHLDGMTETQVASAPLDRAENVATVLETRIGTARKTAWTNAVTEIELARGARLRHYAWIDETASSFHTARTALRLDRDAAVETFAGAGGGGVMRNEIVVALAGEGGEARVDGIALGRGRAHIDNWTEIVHAAPHTNSRQVFKSVLDDRSRSAFQGRVVVTEGAQKVDAQHQPKPACRRRARI
jgi:Fe-S cluster assembly protein SufD